MSEARFVMRLTDWRGVPVVALYEDEDGVMFAYDHRLDLWTRF
jgi:hypothetical protein